MMSMNMVKGALVSFAAFVMMVFPVGISPAWAIMPVGSTLTVTTLNDEQNVNGLCSLREAIINANNNNQSGSVDCAAGTGADTINFSVTGTIILGDQLPGITEALTIDGPGAGSLTISGNNLYRIIGIAPAIAVNMQNLTIADGAAPDNSGAGIFSYGILTISNCAFSNNTASIYGGAIYNCDFATLNILNSTFSVNSAGYYGGAIYNALNATANISNSTFSGNSVPASGGAIFNYQDAIANISNSTFSGNTAAYGGGLYNRSLATANISSSTFSGNSAAVSGGAIMNFAAVILQNSIVANSPSGGNCYNEASLNSIGYNLDTDNTCSLTEPTDLPNTSPQLGVLADNGGPTDTMALDPGSPAVDRIPFGVNGCGTTMTTDQRGFLRPSAGGGPCDIGAYEADQQTFDLSGSWSVLYSLSRGTNLSGILRARNTGTGNAGSFKVAVYLSSNGVTLGSLLKTYTVSALNAGTSKNISFSYISNISLSGKFLIAVIDSGNQITETNESNNRAVVKIQ